MDNLFKKFDEILDDDLARLGLIRNANENGEKANKTTKRKHKEFVKYLLSVATHPIGLRASVEPFNSCQEHMLAYIMEMFKLSDANIRKMLIVNEGAIETDKQKIGWALNAKQPVVGTIKRHSWRPELRLRLNAPSFFYDPKYYLNNLFVRVYLFKEEQTIDDSTMTPQNSNEQDLDQTDIRSRGILNKIFKRFQLNSSKLIRPVNEMRHLLKFKPYGPPQTKLNQMRLMHKMVQVIDANTLLMEDIYIHIRRYYCEPKTNHILRFEFWLDTQQTRLSFLDRYRRYVRQFVYNGFFSCCFTRRRSTYMNERQELYGYINIKMTQLPSYPIKQNFSVLTLHERKVNNCEICIDIRNRRIREEEQSRQAAERNIHEINHLRLYVNSMVYQCLTLGQLNRDSISKKEIYQNIAIDNLFYLPAYGLINQHRLQSNLSLFDDQSLRRTSFLLLLIKIYQRNAISKSGLPKLEGLMILLISVLQNEYMMAHRVIDDRTLQEIDPFLDAASSNVLKLELATLQRFIQLFLKDRLKDWLLKAEMKRSSLGSGLYITLNSLRMFKSAISSLVKCIRIRRLAAELQDASSNLKVSVNRLLCELILSNLSANIENIAYSASKSPKRRRINRQSITMRPVFTNQDGDSLWALLLYKINSINHDLSLYWSRNGLDGLILSEHDFVNKLNMFYRLEKRNFRKFIVEKIDNYLK